MELNKPIYLILLIALFAWCLLILLPALLVNTGDTGKFISEIDYKFFGHICHQFEGRSLHLGEHKMAVCARCSGIYFGFLIGVLFFPFLKKIKVKNIKYPLVLISLPMIIDISLDFLSMHQSTLLTKSLTGLMFGFPSAILLYPSFEQAIAQLINQKERKQYHVRKT
jgi:uncharacterized membrane protein